jgi:hypothetical protein
MFGEAYKATRQQAVGVGGNADDGAAPLYTQSWRISA